MGYHGPQKKFSLLLFIIVICRIQASDYNGEMVDDDYGEVEALSEDCVCLPAYQCEDGVISHDGAGQLDPRRLSQDTGFHLNTTSNNHDCGPFHVCCYRPRQPKVHVHRCGTRNTAGIAPRIMSGNEAGEAKFGEWPWQAAIVEKDGDKVTFRCGATLIDDKHVLTVAHCVENFVDHQEKLIVRLGEWDLNSTQELPAHEEFCVTDIFIHEMYTGSNLRNDIAVVRLANETSFKQHIDSACLPRDDDDFTGQQCVVTGWGTTDSYEDGNYSLILKQVTVPVLAHNNCQRLLRRTRLGRYFKLYAGFLCAGGVENRDSCRGDGGGPLVCYRQEDNSYILAGLVSWGISCGYENIPGVYVNVRRYIDWIKSKTGKDVEYYWSTSA